MTIYTVHAPPPKADDIALDPERFEFIRDGFGFWAFVFAPLWMLWRRLWLVLLFYVAVIAVLQGALWFIRANPTTRGRERSRSRRKRLRTSRRCVSGWARSSSVRTSWWSGS